MDKYIYFHRSIELYETEQFGAFLYEFMENIQIATIFNRILVIPNVFIAPRNNKKILKSNHIYLKSLSSVPLSFFIDFTNLEKYVKILSLSEFYEKTYENPAVVICNKTRNNLSDFIVENNLNTSFGKLKIASVYDIDTFTLDIIKYQSNEKLMDFKNIIVINNGRLGQPNWHNVPQLEYKKIRNLFKFSDYIEQIANEFIEKNKINENTLMFHWRRGDFLLNSSGKLTKDENETSIYYRKHADLCSPENVLIHLLEIKLKNKNIDKLLLIHNNENKNEVDLLKSELLNFNINVIEYNHPTYEPFYEQYEGIIQQLIASHCKYQLYGPTCYERMSQFGRWIIEERDKYYSDRDDIYFINK